MSEPPAIPPPPLPNAPPLPPAPEPPADPNLALDVRGLVKKYGTLAALDGLTFQVPAGVIAGFVGPNGAGKTTTMRVLATLLKPDAGRARIFGMDVQRHDTAKEVRHALGFMPDYFGLYNDMTAGEYLDFFAAAYRIPLRTRETLVNDILAIVGLTVKKDTLIAGLSRGMQQRLSLGRCLVHSPRLLLLDEPASGLDPRARIELMELLRELRRMGKTIFISSHILSELHHLCDMVVIVEKGKLVYSGTLADASNHLRAGRQYMELLVAGDAGAAMALLQEMTGVGEVRREGQMIFVEYGEPLESGTIINFCVAKGIRLEEARRGQARLEEIFMTLTAAE